MISYCQFCKASGKGFHKYSNTTNVACMACGKLMGRDQAIYVKDDEVKQASGGAKDTAGGAKFDQGKVRPSLILHGFPRAIEAVAKVGMYGLTLHEEGSWKDVPNGMQRYRDALQRHLLKHATEDKDKDSGLLHEAHAAWNALAVLELRMLELERAKPL